MQAEIRFPAFHSRTIPVMLGSSESLSHDRLMDEMTRQYYYRGVISLNRADIPEEYRARITCGHAGGDDRLGRLEDGFELSRFTIDGFI